MTPLLDRLQGDLNAARKGQDKERTILFGMVISEAKNREIELRRPLTDDDVLDVLRKAIKRRKESVEMYEKGGRVDLAAKEAAEASALELFLPAAMPAEEVRAIVRAAVAGGAANVGAVMAKVMPALKGKADGAVINAIVREELAAKP